MKLTSEKIVHTHHYIEVDGKKLPIGVLLDTLDDLEQADGLAVRLVIYEKDVANWLVEKGAAQPNARGSYGYGENLDAVRKEVEDFLEREGYYETLL